MSYPTKLNNSIYTQLKYITELTVDNLTTEFIYGYSNKDAAGTC